MQCMVRYCGYVVASAIEDFQVCLIHDHPNVRRLLERGEAPTHYWMGDVPIVVGSGPLTVEDFKQIEGGDSPFDCPLLREAPAEPRGTIVHPHFRLSR